MALLIIIVLLLNRLCAPSEKFRHHSNRLFFPIQSIELFSAVNRQVPHQLDDVTTIKFILKTDLHEPRTHTQPLKHCQNTIFDSSQLTLYVCFVVAATFPIWSVASFFSYACPVSLCRTLFLVCCLLERNKKSTAIKYPTLTEHHINIDWSNLIVSIGMRCVITYEKRIKRLWWFDRMIQNVIFTRISDRKWFITAQYIST